MNKLLGGIFSIGITLIIIAFIAIPFGWYGFASVIGVIGAVLALIGYVPLFVFWFLGKIQ